MASDERNFRAGDLFRHRTGLFRIAGVILDVQHQLLAEHAAGSIEVGHRHFGAVLQLAAERGIAAGHRARHGDGDVLRKRGGRQRQRCADGQAEELD